MRDPAVHVVTRRAAAAAEQTRTAPPLPPGAYIAKAGFSFLNLDRSIIVNDFYMVLRRFKDFLEYVKERIHLAFLSSWIASAGAPMCLLRTGSAAHLLHRKLRTLVLSKMQCS